MNPELTKLADQLHVLSKKLMETDPWEPGYGEVVAIHESLLKVLRDKAQLDYAEFTKYLQSTSADIVRTWTSAKPVLKQWDQWLKPIFEDVEIIIKNAVPLLALLV